ncbi:hypothetical protein [Micromonospora hortensis]|uniref:hypothetical protein n=1 Tax=Micromonospora hortensis TaxID=2911209 RepID=UPI001EE87366|nr:hypothetical protein [Micromonospora hortensis]MCG5448575.1 hypothetical protein [Micromonospora hortensis]
MTDRRTLRSPLPGPPNDHRAAPARARSAADSTVSGTARPAAVAPPLVAAVARGVALVVVLPVRLLWELIVAAGRLLHRYLFRPTGRFLRRWLLAPLACVLQRLVWLPLVWCVRHLLWLPLLWVARTVIWPVLVWLTRHGLRPALVVLGRVLIWLAKYLVLWPLYWVGTVLTPVGRLVAAAVVGAWRTAGRVLRLLHRLLLRPLGRGLRWLWRATVTPAARWARRSVLDPARLAVREVLEGLGLRR